MNLFLFIYIEKLFLDPRSAPRSSQYDSSDAAIDGDSSSALSLTGCEHIKIQSYNAQESPVPFCYWDLRQSLREDSLGSGPLRVELLGSSPCPLWSSLLPPAACWRLLAWAAECFGPCPPLWAGAVLSAPSLHPALRTPRPLGLSWCCVSGLLSNKYCLYCMRICPGKARAVAPRWTLC